MNGTSQRPPNPGERSTVADVLQDLEPMGALSRFAIGGLTPEEEDEFFGILEEA